MKKVAERRRKPSRMKIELGKRRFKVLLLAGVGYTNRDICEFLGVSRRVVYKDMLALGCMLGSRPKKRRTVMGERILAKALKFMAQQRLVSERSSDESIQS